MPEKKLITSTYYQFFIGTVIAAVLIKFDLLKAEPYWVRFLGLPAVGLVYLFFYFANIDKVIYLKKESGFSIIFQLLFYAAICLVYAIICMFFAVAIVKTIINPLLGYSVLD